MMRKFLSSEDGGILSMVIKIGIAVLVIGFILAEVGPVVWERISTMQDAEDVANGVAAEVKLRNNADAGRVKAADMMKLMGFSDAEITESHVDFTPNDTTPLSVKVTLIKNAKTLLTSHLSFMNKWSHIACSSTAEIATANQPGVK